MEVEITDKDFCIHVSLQSLSSPQDALIKTLKLIEILDKTTRGIDNRRFNSYLFNYSN